MASSDHTGDHHGSGSFPADPMHQFEIKRLLDINIAGLDISCLLYTSPSPRDS